MGQSEHINYFNRDLEYSLEQREEELFDNFYFRVFPELDNKRDNIIFVTDIKLQKKGIDKILILNTGQKISIDEKKRRENYNDILLEIWSNYENKVKGWLFTSCCHYIVYAIMPTNKVYLLPMILLRKAWRSHEFLWIKSFPKIIAKNPNYNTISIGITPNILLSAIKFEMEDNFNAKG